MKLFLHISIIIFISLSLVACQTVTNKIDENVIKEEKELSKWLNQSESELKIVFGQPDKVQFTDQGNRYYIYATEKYKIKCERKFELNPKNMIIGFTSKNCF